MSIAASDLIAYAAANRPNDDSSTTGGAIDTDHRIVFAQMGANDKLNVFSSSGADTSQVVTVIGRKPNGSITTSTATLNGTNKISLSPDDTFAIVLRCTVGADCVGTVTLERETGSVLVGTIPPGERGFHALFYDSVSEETETIRREKFFDKNCHATLSLNAAKVTLTSDPPDKIRIGLAAAVNDTQTIANRKATPGGITFHDDNDPISVPGTDLAAGDAIGVWAEQTLDASDNPVRSTFTVKLSGQSTA